MDRNEYEEPREDLAVEITDLNEDGDDESSSISPSLFTGSWLLAPEYRKRRRIATVAFVGLAILVVLFTTTPFRQLFMHASSTTEQSTYYYGLDANPPWGHLSVDGKRVALISKGAYTLFSLPRGQHTLTWSAAPFSPQQCSISVPVGSDSDNCKTPDAVPGFQGNITSYISFPANLSMLSVAQRAALIQAAQVVLDSQQSSETVRAGELYAQTPVAAGASTRSCTVLHVAALCFVAANQPLRATLRLQLERGSSPNAPCAAGACDSGNQNCRLFCDLPAFIGSNTALSPAVWQTSVVVNLLWRFATVDGRVVAENQADSFILGEQNDIEVSMNITWNGKQWGVTLTGQRGFNNNDEPVCSAAYSNLYTLVFASAAPDFVAKLVPGPTPASGCLIQITLQPGSNTEPTPTAAPPTVANVIQRFGVLLAVNATAHHLWPFLPVADAYEQQVAQQLICC
ncbi:MAG TPA: hypothetical protein VKR83_07370 [Ktedonobacteraceae bacterium]|nr:hypothetical protein [Ktedonobacteraceae bacterium]